jgi:hypothetical protein
MLPMHSTQGSTQVAGGAKEVRAIRQGVWMLGDKIICQPADTSA